jgi:hypothetical protein
MHIRLSKIWVDYDEMYQIDLVASSGGYACKIDFYVYAEQISEFGIALSNYTGAFGQDSTFEVGSKEDNSYCWVRVRAFAFDHSGHSAIEVATYKNGAPHVRTSSSFSGEVEVAAINELGRRLVAWANEKDLDSQFSFPDC